MQTIARALSAKTHTVLLHHCVYRGTAAASALRMSAALLYIAAP
ncbi:hypothetical protein HMPREF1051_2514 [Neisseria sicca VK64]|uniref:Uncharacterized protein n=1 Tax=Neisseria sicca VK64 TaxID=1095748 RepID=I2NFE1_NEISI|nr:hypothetical protein HMPREF1051_2514 [Neisseria sicca VK64]